MRTVFRWKDVTEIVGARPSLMKRQPLRSPKTIVQTSTEKITSLARTSWGGKVIPDMNLTARELKNILDKVDDNTIITIDVKSPKQIKIGIEYERRANFIEKVVSAIANALSVLGTGKQKAPGSNIAKTTFDIITERGASDEL